MTKAPSVKPRVVFLGTPQFAVPILQAAIQATEVVLVVTQPDRRAGRGKKMQPPPVKEMAIEHGIEVAQPASTKGPEGRALRLRIEALNADFLVTAAYGKILGRRLLGGARCDALNVHASLLPRHRGAAPINHAILEGAATTGVSIMRMEQGLDSGPVFLQSLLDIEPEETAGELTERLSYVGAKALITVLSDFDAHSPPVPQDESLATHAPMMRKEDGKLDWSLPAATLHNRVRGLHPWPCACAHKEGLIYKIHSSIVGDEAVAAAEVHARPGTIVRLGAEGIDVTCGQGVLRLTELQAPGKKRLPADQFLSGTPWKTGDRFD